LLASKGILDKPSQRSLSQANLYFFTPCLIFAKLAGQLRWTVIQHLWALPLLVAVLIGDPIGINWMFISVGVGFVVARVGSRMLGLDRQWTKFVVACTIFQNVHDGLAEETDFRPMPRRLRL
jgi:auxin efflux carrier family protein